MSNLWHSLHSQTLCKLSLQLFVIYLSHCFQFLSFSHTGEDSDTAGAGAGDSPLGLLGGLGVGGGEVQPRQMKRRATLNFLNGMLGMPEVESPAASPKHVAPPVTRKKSELVVEVEAEFSDDNSR